MPGDKKHHTDKFRRCVEEVKGKGHSEDSAYAICTTSLQNAGEPIFENAQDHDDVKILASSEIRELHLCGATGQVRYETLNGRKHLVVPVIALMEGVIHPVNAETPEFVSAEVLRRAAPSWIGKPVTLGHPKRNGTQCSANDAGVRKEAGIGVIMVSEFKDRKLLQEAWIDEEKAKQLHPRMYETLAGGGREEVSVGAFVVTKKKESSHNGKPYKGEWLETQGDHLALLPGGRGACSCEMGCGTHRAAMHFVAAESIELLPTMPIISFSTLEAQSLDERIAAVGNAVNGRWNKKSGSVEMASPSDFAYPLQVFDDRVIVRKGEDTFSVDYTIEDDEVKLGDAVKVKQQWVEAAAAYTECLTCHGTGQVKSGMKQEDCPSCDGTGKMMKAAAGARHSASDMRMIQAMHDHAVNLGAVCDRKNLETAAAPPQSNIRHEGGKWVLYSTNGKLKLAEYVKKADAEEHEDRLRKTMARRAS